MRYSNVSRRVWNDARFRDLTDSAKLLWFRLLTGPELTNVPGLFAANDAQLAKAMGWSSENFSKAFAELSEGFEKPLAKANWEAGLVWIPRAVFHNKPQSPNVVKSWIPTIDELPECDLKTEACQAFRKFSESLGEGFRKAFEKLPQSFSKPSSNQEQEQEQEQDIDPPVGPPGDAKPKKPKAWTRVAADWQPTAKHTELARSLRVDPSLELAKFRDHEFAKPKRDADAAFANWLRNASGYGGARKPPAVQRGAVPESMVGNRASYRQPDNPGPDPFA